MDFVYPRIIPKKYIIEPSFVAKKRSDLMVRGKAFYAVWDEEAGLWSTDPYDVIRLVDRDLYDYRETLIEKELYSVSAMQDFKSRSLIEFNSFLKNCPDNYTILDNKITFLHDKVEKTDYVSKRLSYDLAEGDRQSYEKIVTTLYDEEERRKFEWAIGGVIAGEAHDIQKFIVFYGPGGSGKSTILDIIDQLFSGYTAKFQAKDLVGSNNQFSLEQFRTNPLVAIQTDGDLSKIEDNSKLNTLVAHEEIVVNEKFKAQYTTKFNAMLFMATNSPVKITDSKSGLLRRLIDISPSGRKLSHSEYRVVTSRIKFELGAIAYHCLQVYKELGPDYYDNYIPKQMMFRTNPFFNFVEENYDVFSEQDSTTLKAAYDMYKEYMKDSGFNGFMHKGPFREELKSYFKSFFDVKRIGEKRVRSYYEGFRKELFDEHTDEVISEVNDDGSLWDDSPTSVLDEILGECPAQYSKENGSPRYAWSKVKTKLKDLDPRKEHYVLPPSNMVVIDFDLKNEKGEKDLEKNLKAAKMFPPTYTEISKGGQGLHLHYFYDGDIDELSSFVSEGIEIKTFKGRASLRRRLSRHFGTSIALLTAGSLPRKEPVMVKEKVIKDEMHLVNLIEKALRKEVFPNTKPNVDFIKKILDDAYASGMKYDVSDMRNRVLSFGMDSTNQADICLKIISNMKWKSDEPSAAVESDGKIVFFDVEVFPNLFVLCWKYQGADQVVRMINPTPEDVEQMFDFKLIGFNNRRYDNHIIYARAIRRYTEKQLFELSQRIINSKDRDVFFNEAYNLSYTDVYDFASAGNKKGLKKWEIELGIYHLENSLPWDQDVPKDLWDQIADYCANDVISTEAVFNHLQGDWVARQILAKLSGLTVNDTTNSHSTKIIFGDEKHPDLVYTDLSETFPGYIFENGKSFYRGEEVGEGGYVYAEPGMYGAVALLDVASMHPTSIEQLHLLGDKGTRRFSEIKKARIYIKHGELDKLRDMFNGAFASFVDDKTVNLKDLSNALKTVINSVYGLTAANFSNPFRDERNVDNIVAKRGALFMVDLKHAVQERGFVVAHIKTDSIKIPDATPEIIQFVMDFGQKYGYTFEHEDTYDKMCLVNDSVYIAKSRSDGKWHATGAQFAHPYVFKTLFSRENIIFRDYCETKSVSTAMYLDYSTENEKKEPVFVGKVGSFVPVKKGGMLLRKQGDKLNAVTGTKGYLWKEADRVTNVSDIDMSYFTKLVDDAKSDISQYGDVYWFCSDASYSGVIPFDDDCPFDETPFMNPPEKEV